MLEFKCPIEIIPQEEFEKLKKKEQAYIVMVYEKKFSDKEIMDRLFIELRQTYWAFKKRVKIRLTYQTSKNKTQ
jgi:hypothetical protein